MAVQAGRLNTYFAGQVPHRGSSIAVAAKQLLRHSAYMLFPVCVNGFQCLKLTFVSKYITISRKHLKKFCILFSQNLYQQKARLSYRQSGLFYYWLVGGLTGWQSINMIILFAQFSLHFFPCKKYPAFYSP